MNKSAADDNAGQCFRDRSTRRGPRARRVREGLDDLANVFLADRSTMPPGNDQRCATVYDKRQHYRAYRDRNECHVLETEKHAAMDGVTTSAAKATMARHMYRRFVARTCRPATRAKAGERFESEGEASSTA